MPKVVNIEERRREITAAAIAVIDTHGLEGARLRDVARAANVTTGAVTHYFDGKEAMLEAALEGLVTDILARLDAAGEGPAISLVDVAWAFLPVDDESRRGWRVWLAYCGRAIHAPELRAQHQRYYKDIGARLIRLAQAARPALSADEAQAAADALIAAVDGVGVRATLEPEDWPPPRMRATLVLLLAHLGKS